MDIEVITIPKDELLELIDQTVSRAVERAMRPPDEVLTLAELCTYRKRSPATIHRLVKRGMPRQSDGRFRRSEVDAWLAMN